MRFVVIFFFLFFKLSLSRALVCPSSYRTVLGVCLHFSAETEQMSWCKAQQHCASVNGELVRGYSYLPLAGKKFQDMPYRFWIGLTDFRTERWRNRTGWQWTDGAINPPSAALKWFYSSSTKSSRSDCVRECSGSGKLCEANCDTKQKSVCQPRLVPRSASRSTSFKPTPIPVGLPDDAFARNGCTKEVMNIDGLLDCMVLCNSEEKDWCVAIYFNEAKKICRQVQYTDATIDMGDAHGWVKFVME